MSVHPSYASATPGRKPLGGLSLRSIPALGPESRILAWTVGTIALVIGLSEALLPFTFENASYDIARSALLELGLIEAALGIGVLVWLVLPLERTRLPQLSLLLCGAAAAGWSVSVILTGNWTVACLNFPLAAALVLTAVGLEVRLRQRVRGNPLAATLAVGLALTGLGLLLFAGTLSIETYAYARPHAAL